MCFLFVDRILSSTPGQIVSGLKHITWDDTYLSFDQHGHAHFCPSLVGETLGQLAAWNVMAYHDFKLRPVAGIVGSARLLRPARPGETLLLESIIDDLDETAVRYHAVAKVGEDPVFVLEGAIGPLLPMENFIDVARVRQQYNEINRPGEWPVGANASIHKSQEQIYPSVTTRPTVSMLFDSVNVIEPGKQWEAIKLVSRAAPYFPDHFPNNPVLPMTVLLECKLNLVRAFVKQAAYAQDYQIRELRRIKMNEFIHPGDVVTSHLKLKSLNEQELSLTCQSEVDGKRVCIVEIKLTATECSKV